MKKFRIIIAGGRDYANYEYVKKEVYYLTKDMDANEIEIVSGGCDVPGVLTFVRVDGSKVYGADGLGERLAEVRGYAVKVFMADWKNHGRAAGPIRNKKMAEYATHSLCFWDGKSTGTKSMIDYSERFGLLGSVLHVEQRTEP